MNSYFPQNFNDQLTPAGLQSGNLSLINWLNGFEDKNVIEFEAITSIVADICNTPLVLMGLFENEKTHFQASFEPGNEELIRAERICQRVKEDQSFVDVVEVEELTDDVVNCVGVPLKTSDNTLLGAICVINFTTRTLSDTERTALENLAKLATLLFEQKSLALREEKQLKFLEENTSVEMYLVNPLDLTIMYANHNALKSLGYPTNTFINQDISEILVTKRQDEFRQKLIDLIFDEKKSFSTFAEQINFDGSKVLVKLFVSYVREGYDSSILIISRNLSSAGFESDFVDYLSNYDSITGLANRRLFENLLSEKIHTSIDTPDESGMLLIDLENFRLLNKTFGFSAGDNIVRQLSKVLVNYLGSEEILVRTSMENFCVLLPNCTESQIKSKAVEIIDLVDSQNFIENGKKFKLQINIGAVIIKSSDSQSTDYLSLAHKACDIAKEFGQNQFYLADPFDPLFIQKTIEMEQLVNVQDAIERNKLQLFGQKIGGIGTNAGQYDEHYEILIRMLNKDGNPVPPVAFIPQLEKHGSIISLDKWVLKESLRLIDERHRLVNYPISKKDCLYNINLSARTISDACFMSYCTELLVKYQHLAPFICFEITETVAISNFKTAQDFIRIIRRFGCKFALDDFGAGGASLECLKELSIDFVKIDGSFISDINENPISQIIVESICRVANVLNVKVIAEKVESQEIEDALMKYGVHYIQGYKIQRPQPFITGN
ncbi:MAG: EAL domain-containing protein [Pyrinomonadaceae bacterium]|nr:EAL domain-containing protein [Pyrinomonadaceae bacterium]